MTKSRKTSKGSFSITKFEDEKSASLVTSINARSWNFKVKMRLGRPWPSFFVAYKVRMVCAYFQKNFFFALLPFLLPINFFSVKLLFRKEENRFTKLKKVTSSKTEIFKCWPKSSWVTFEHANSSAAWWKFIGVITK